MTTPGGVIELAQVWVPLMPEASGMGQGCQADRRRCSVCFDDFVVPGEECEQKAARKERR